MYSLIYAYTDNIYCHKCIFTSNDRFTGIYGSSGRFGITTSTLKIPLLRMGLLLRMLSKAVRCLLLVMGMQAFLFRAWSTLFSTEDQALKLLGFTSLVLSYSGLGILSSLLRTKY